MPHLGSCSESISPFDLGATDGMDVESYFRRISYFGGSSVPSVETLRSLCTAHVQSVPFENFGVIAKESIELKEELLFDKIINRRRGGICYELNILFRGLLESLGYDVILLSARVFDKKKQQFGPDCDHMTLSVAIPQRPDERYLADVGTPGILGAPLRLVDGASQRYGNYDIRLRVDTSSTWYVERKGLDVWPDFLSPAGPARVSSEWEKTFQFTLQPRELDDFSETMLYHQTSPEGPLTQGHLAIIIPKDSGRVLFTDQGKKGPRLIETKQDDSGSSFKRTVTLLEEGHVNDILKLHFGLVL